MLFDDDERDRQPQRDAHHQHGVFWDDHCFIAQDDDRVGDETPPDQLWGSPSRVVTVRVFLDAAVQVLSFTLSTRSLLQAVWAAVVKANGRQCGSWWMRCRGVPVSPDTAVCDLPCYELDMGITHEPPSGSRRDGRDLTSWRGGRSTVMPLGSGSVWVGAGAGGATVCEEVRGDIRPAQEQVAAVDDPMSVNDALLQTMQGCGGSMGSAAPGPRENIRQGDDCGEWKCEDQVFRGHHGTTAGHEPNAKIEQYQYKFSGEEFGEVKRGGGHGSSQHPNAAQEGRSFDE
jgi:hypothetical protein